MHIPYEEGHVDQDCSEDEEGDRRGLQGSVSKFSKRLKSDVIFPEWRTELWIP